MDVPDLNYCVGYLQFRLRKCHLQWDAQIFVPSTDQDLQKWTQLAVDRERKDRAIGSDYNLYQLIRSEGLWEPSLGELVKESNSLLIHSDECRLRC